MESRENYDDVKLRQGDMHAHVYQMINSLWIKNTSGAPSANYYEYFSSFTDDMNYKLSMDLMIETPSLHNGNVLVFSNSLVRHFV